MDDNNKSDNKAGNWHLSREVPIALIFAWLVAITGGTWWMALVDSRVGHLEISVANQTSYDQRQWAEINATRQLTANNDKRIATIEAKQDYIIKILVNLNSQMDKIVDRMLKK